MSVCYAPQPEERYAVAKTGTPHENAVAVLRAFISGDRPSFKETKDAAGLLIDLIDSLEKKLSYQVCGQHGPVNAKDRWACGICLEERTLALDKLEGRQ